jgi:hypothetical protein
MPRARFCWRARSSTWRTEGGGGLAGKRRAAAESPLADESRRPLRPSIALHCVACCITVALALSARGTACFHLT